MRKAGYNCMPFSVHRVRRGNYKRSKTSSTTVQVKVTIGGQKMIALSPADGIAFCTEKEDLLILLDSAEEIFGRHGMKSTKRKPK